MKKEERRLVEGVKMISKFEEVEKDRDCGRERERMKKRFEIDERK